MLKFKKLPLLICLFLLSSMIGSTVFASNTYNAQLSGDAMFMVKKLPVFSFNGPTIDASGNLTPPEVLRFYEHRVPVPTAATGKLTLKIRGQEVRYKLKVDEENLWRGTIGSGAPGSIPGRVGVAHIHLGKQGAIGPIMFEIVSPGSEAVNGVFSGTLTASDLYTKPARYGQNQPKYLAEYGIVTMADAIEAIRNGNTNVIIHTEKHWMGEIGGQIDRKRHNRPH